jgi:uncharacterized protein (TIGR04141 family)
MAKFNIYKINKDQQNDLEIKLPEIGLILIKNEIIENYNVDFYLSTEPDEIDIWWTHFYRSFFEEISLPKNKVYFGLLLIHNDNICYSISLGKSHFYLKPYCDINFGINLAERIVDKNNLRLKNSKHFKSKRSKSIVSYLDNTDLDYDSGESLHFIKAKTINSDSWGKIASFGQSAQLSLDILPNQLPSLIQRIETELSNPNRISIPKAELIKNPDRISELNTELILAISNLDDSTVESEEFSLSGIDFIFYDTNQYQYYLKGEDYESEVLDELSISSFRNYIDKFQIDLNTSLNLISVRVIREEGRSFSKPIMSILEFVTDQRECLLDGKWHVFNQSYIDLLISRVDKIITHYDPTQNITMGTTEDTFNNNQIQNGYLNVDKDLVMLANRYSVEKMDLYRDETLFFVKKGIPQKLNYVIDQALNTINLLKNNESKITHNGSLLVVKKINLWLLIQRVNDIEKISDLNSLIFLMKLSNLYQEVVDFGLSLEINYNYIR